MENNKKTYINYARGIAIILVVFGHMIEMTLINESVKFNIDFAFYLLHVPTFLLISGYLFKYYNHIFNSIINNVFKTIIP